jgi:hypothetical protein
MIEEARTNAEAISAMSYRYCREHHALAAVSARFVSATADASFRWADIDPALRRKGILRAAFEQLRHWRRAVAGAAS